MTKEFLVKQNSLVWIEYKIHLQTLIFEHLKFM